ncbi:MAG: hypothetical protein ACFFEL_04330 [Candidatus Thorarchaeota archaeon]
MNPRQVRVICFIVIFLIVVGGIVFVLIPQSPPEMGVSNPEEGIYRFSGTLSGEDDYLIHSVRVNGSAISMHVVLWCGGNDFDLYGAVGYSPSPIDYIWRGYAVGGEDLTYEYPDEGIWHIMVQSYSGSGPYELGIDITY